MAVNYEHPDPDGIKIFAIVSPYGLAKTNKKRTLKLYIIPPVAGVAHVLVQWFTVFRVNCSPKSEMQQALLNNI